MPNSIGYRVKSLRAQRDWSQRELAEQAGVGRSWLSQVESGDIPSPGGVLLDRLARTLGVSERFLLTGETPSDSAEKGTLLHQLGHYSARQLDQLLHIAHVIFLEEQPHREAEEEGQEQRRQNRPEPESHRSRQR